MHHNLETKPVPEKVLYINEPDLADASFYYCLGCLHPSSRSLLLSKLFTTIHAESCNAKYPLSFHTNIAFPDSFRFFLYNKKKHVKEENYERNPIKDL